MAKGIRVAFFSVVNWKPGMRAFEEREITFEWHLGMSWQQKQKSSKSMLEQLELQGYNPIEISRRSEDMEFGVQLSAFNLKINNKNVENIFQAYKVFNDGGPYYDLLEVDPKSAKNDCRIQTKDSKKPCQTYNVAYKNKEFFTDENICDYCRTRQDRELIRFESKKAKWAKEPKSMFYDAIYIAALLQNKQLSNKLVEFNAFTDIEFNQKTPYATLKGPFNCQARSCAIYSTLKQAKISDVEITDIIQSPERMKELYGATVEVYEQQSLL